MKNSNINTILQIIAIVFLIVIGYFTLSSNDNLNIISTELKNTKEELKNSKETIISVQNELKTAQMEFKKMKAQKDLIIHKRDSLILSFEKRNAKDWEDLMRIKDSIKITNDKLTEDRLILDRLFGLKNN